ncbi:hypothetical protein KJ616_02905 [Patescibacteria group bacterium]|nr:hypothetical protein [Patescibacteria group bacterium]
MGEEIKRLFEEYKKFRANMKPTVFDFGPFHYKDLSIRDRRRLALFQRKTETYLDSISNEQLAELLLDIKDIELTGKIQAIISERESYSNIKKGWLYKLGLIPTFTEVVLFLTGLTFLLLLFLNTLFLEEFFDFFLRDFDLEMIGIMIFFIIGLVMSFYYVFSNKIIPRKSKGYILLFAVIINFLVGFFAGFYALTRAKGFVIIFPSVNIISAFLLLFFVRINLITTKSILDKQAKLSEILIGSIIVIVVFTISQYVFHNYWAITFSLCLVYATNINHFISKWLR